MRFIVVLILFMSLFITSLSAEKMNVVSPDGKIAVSVKTTDRVYYKVEYEGRPVIWYSPISMTLEKDQVLGKNPTIEDTETRQVSNTIQTVWGIRSQIQDVYNELEIKFEDDFSLIFRVYDDGMAYRFKTDIKGDITVYDEEVEYRFTKDHLTYSHIVDNYQTSYEMKYSRLTVNELSDEPLVSLPVLVDQENVKVAITESDVFDYPGMYFDKWNNARPYLKGSFPEYALETKQGGHSQFNMRVTERADYIARTNGERVFPWRLMIIGDEDIDMADNDLVYQLARPSKIETDWIKPGKVAWDWWNDWNLEGVDFETGVNNKTYEYYIDFAAENNIPYVIMDEGWSDQFDMMLPTGQVDVPHLVEYGKMRGVKIILWGVWFTIDRQMDEALDLFEKWGVAGLKIDFVDRDDQYAINFYERLAREAAKHKLLIDYHGCSKPTGLHRTYPNVVNFEGVRGNEYNKFSTGETPQHNIDIVFTRMISGPMDYTPGAMRNSTKGNFSTNNSNPMSYGTRCHQLGMFVVYYGPLQMLCDAPTEYEKYPDIMKFLSEVPVSWDETKVLKGKMGEYVAIARKKENKWYIGVLNDWNERKMTLDLSFIERPDYTIEMYVDGVNANRKAEDYIYKTMDAPENDLLEITLKQGGGAAIVIE